MDALLGCQAPVSLRIGRVSFFVASEFAYDLVHDFHFIAPKRAVWRTNRMRALILTVEIADAAKAWGQNDDITGVTVRRSA